MLNIELVEENAKPVLYIRTRTAMENLPKIISEGYMKIAAYMEKLGIEPQEVPYTEYYNLDMKDLDVEMGFPVSKLIDGSGEIMAKEIPQGRFVTCTFIGPYSQMEKPYQDIAEFIKEKGLEQTGECFEYYYNSPAEVPESELKTKIMIPVK